MQRLSQLNHSRYHDSTNRHCYNLKSQKSHLYIDQNETSDCDNSYLSNNNRGRSGLSKRNLPLILNHSVVFPQDQVNITKKTSTIRQKQKSGDFCFDKLPISNILDNLSDDQSNAGSKYYELASSNADATKERIDQKEDRGCGDMD